MFRSVSSQLWFCSCWMFRFFQQLVSASNCAEQGARGEFSRADDLSPAVARGEVD